MLSSSMSGSVFCQVCLQFQALSADLFEPLVRWGGTIGWVADPFCCTESGHTDLHVGGPWQQTDAEGMHPLRARSNTRWQCVSVAAGHLAGRLDGRVCCQRLWDPATRSTSDGLAKIFLHSCTAAKVSIPKKPQSLRKENHTERTEWKKKLTASQDMAGKRWCGLFSHGPLRFFMGFKRIFSGV